MKGRSMTPFHSKKEASYWGGGQIVPFKGGYVSLHAVSTPNGVDTYTVAADGRNEGLIPGYIFATPVGGGAKCICVDIKVCATPACECPDCYPGT
jgi:hypothetical protein